MRSEAIEHVRNATGEVLPVVAYRAEFYERFRRVNGVVWKLERAQYFHEPDVPSWVAMMEGDWDRSLRLIRTMCFDHDLPPGVELRRLRVVDADMPLTPYVQWEIALLAARSRAGEHGRVLPASAIRRLERAAPLPELLILGPDLMYEILYDEIGAHLGGRRITDRSLIAGCVPLLADLFEEAEEVVSFFQREVASLPPPQHSLF